jgi:hypothetical protein
MAYPLLAVKGYTRYFVIPAFGDTRLAHHCGEEGRRDAAPPETNLALG